MPLDVLGLLQLMEAVDRLVSCMNLLLCTDLPARSNQTAQNSSSSRIGTDALGTSPMHICMLSRYCKEPVWNYTLCRYRRTLRT